MPDWGQYNQEIVTNILKPRKGTGVCERCGKKTRNKTVFGMTICTECWKKQTRL